MMKKATEVIISLLFLATLIACGKQPTTQSKDSASEAVAKDFAEITFEDNNAISFKTTTSNLTADTEKTEETLTAEKNEQSPVKTEPMYNDTETSSSPSQSKNDNDEEIRKPVPNTEDKPVTTEITKDSEDTNTLEPETEPPHTESKEETTPSTEPESNFNIDYWISYAKSYAQKVDLKLNPDAIYCWDNPIAAGSKCKYTERDIKDCLDWYAINDDISEVWVWAEATGDNSYEIYIGYA